MEVLDANVEGLEYVLQAACGGDADAVQRVRDAFTALRSRDVLNDWRAYSETMRLLSQLATRASEQGPEGLRFERNTLRYKPWTELRSRRGLLAAVAEPEKHLFYAYYRDVLVPRIAALGPRLVGISASDLHQLLPATVLAAMLRSELGDRCPTLVLGGNVFPRIQSVLRHSDDTNRELLRIWGNVIVGEGERGLLDLAHATVRGDALRVIDGLLTYGAAREPAKAPPPRLEELPTPRCDGFKPLVPQMPVPLNIYRGCYYSGICQFCDINYGYDTVWSNAPAPLTRRLQRLRPIDRVIEDVHRSIARYGTRIFNFTDEWFRASEMLEFADQVREGRLGIAWDAYTRFEPLLAEEGVAERLAAGGARFLQFGLETASVRSLQRVRKGISPATSAEILRRTSAAGIWNHVFVIVGLPGETLHDAMLTAAFLLEQAESILSIKPTRFQASRNSPLANGQAGEIDIMQERDALLDISLNRPFQYRSVWQCSRCHSLLNSTTTAGTCPQCKDRLVERPAVSHRATNAMYRALELLVAEHWAYPFTSLYPYHVRLLFSPEQARAIARERAGEADRNLGLSIHEVRELFGTLCRYLRWEAEFCPDVASIYGAVNLTPPRGWRSVDEFGTFARLWASAASQAHREAQMSVGDRLGTSCWSTGCGDAKGPRSSSITSLSSRGTGGVDQLEVRSGGRRSRGLA